MGGVKHNTGNSMWKNSYVYVIALLLLLSCAKKDKKPEPIDSVVENDELEYPLYLDKFLELDTIFIKENGDGVPVGVLEEFFYYKYECGNTNLFKQYIEELSAAHSKGIL